MLASVGLGMCVGEVMQGFSCGVSAAGPANEPLLQIFTTLVCSPVAEDYKALRDSGSCKWPGCEASIGSKEDFAM